MRPAATSRVFDGRFLRVDVERWDDPDRQREIVRHHGAAAVVPVTEAGAVILVRQLREAIRRQLVEIPAGVYDVEGEDAEATARRELTEETGYRALTMEPLGAVHTSPGFSDERIDLFMARVEGEASPEEGIQLVEMSLKEAVDRIQAGEITDAKTVAGIMLAERRLR